MNEGGLQSEGQCTELTIRFSSLRLDFAHGIGLALVEVRFFPLRDFL
jgi:hypothetical protein